MAYQGSNLFKKRHQNTTLLALSINRLEYFLLQLNDGDLLVAWMRVHEYCETPYMPQWWWVLETPPPIVASRSISTPLALSSLTFENSKSCATLLA